MTRFRLHAVALGVLVVMGATLAARRSASPARAHAAIVRLAAPHATAHGAPAADTDWSVAAHLNW